MKERYSLPDMKQMYKMKHSIQQGFGEKIPHDGLNIWISTFNVYFLLFMKELL